MALRPRLSTGLLFRTFVDSIIATGKGDDAFQFGNIRLQD